MKCYGCGQELGTADGTTGWCLSCVACKGGEVPQATLTFEPQTDIGQAVLDLAKAVDRLAQALESKDEWFPVNEEPLPLHDTDAEADNKAYLNDEIGQEGRL
jgi:hypothetical protein